MALSREAVRKVLEEFTDFSHEQTLHGFELNRREARLEHASGISGDNQRVWWLVRRGEDPRSVRRHGELITTKAQLRRVLREWLADGSDYPRPATRPGDKLVARRARNRFGVFWVWRVRRAKP